MPVGWKFQRVFSIFELKASEALITSRGVVPLLCIRYFVVAHDTLGRANLPCLSHTVVVEYYYV